MLRATSVLLALILLTGMSREQVLHLMDGDWQATSHESNWTTESAFAFDADLGLFRGDLAGRRYEGSIHTVVVVGKKVVLTFDGDFSVLVSVVRNDPGMLGLSINGKEQLLYRKVEAVPVP